MQGEPVKWTYEALPTGKNQYELKFTATIGPGWHMYSQFLPEAEIRPVPTSINFKDTTAFVKEGKALEMGRIEHVYDDIFAMNLAYFSDVATFTQKVTLTKPVNEIKGFVEYMVCDAEKCLPPTQKDFSFTVKYEK
jgi:thiol:disulfide interchange protein DsbD